MKKILLIVIFFTNYCYSQTYPDYDKVVTHFFDYHSTSEVSVNTRFSFEKRPDGWYIGIANSSENYSISEKIWSLTTGTFLEVEFLKRKDSTNIEADLEKKDLFLNVYSKKYYNICHYFGYVGWEKDVISKFENDSTLNDTMHYGLGRAYSSASQNLLNNNFGQSLSSERLIHKNYQKLTPAQVQIYNSYVFKAINSFKKTAELNPDFETIVGNIKMKTDNEYLTAFLNLRIYSTEIEASKFLVDNLYSPFFIALAKNYLMSCDKDAVIFVNGDNDTYPLLYVQEKYYYRKDVLVVNLSLLNTSDYINSLQDKMVFTKPFSTSFKSKELLANSFEVSYFKKGQDSLIKICDLISYIKNKKYIGQDYYNPYPTFPTQNIIINAKPNNLILNLNKDFLYRSDLIILDFICQNNWRRPVYYACTVGESSYSFLENSFQSHGLVYNLTQKNQKELSDYIVLNTDEMYSNVINNFEWVVMNNLYPHEKQMCMNYSYIFSSLIEQLLMDNKKDSAALVLNKFLELFPNSVNEYNKYTITFILSAYQLNNNPIGNGIAKQLLLNTKKWANYEEIIETKRHIKSIAQDFNQQEIIDLIESD